jgi:hypothetical protein
MVAFVPLGAGTGFPPGAGCPSVTRKAAALTAAALAHVMCRLSLEGIRP